MYNVMYKSNILLMASKIRKQIYIDPEQEAILKQITQETGVSEAETIRQAIVRYSSLLKHHHLDRNIWQREEEFIKQLIERGGKESPAPIKRTWKREDLYDRFER